MKRLFAWVGILFFIFQGVVSAAPTYGTKMPLKKQAFWGLQHYSVLRRDLDNDLGGLQSRQNFLNLSYGLTDWFSLDLKASLYSRFSYVDRPGAQDREFENPVWGGGYGFRVRLVEEGPFKAVVGFQHISIHPKTVKADGMKTSGILDDWQVSSTVSYSFKNVIPYVGLRYSTMDAIIRIDKDRNRIKSDSHQRWGAIVGCDIPLTKRTWINLEGDLGDDTAFSVGIGMSF